MEESYHETRDYLYSLKNRGSKFGIDRMQRLVEALGHPQKQFPVIHVAGTNGKGSVCSMLEALYRSNGYKTGLFTSPHLLHLGERVQVNRRILDEAGIVRYVEQLKPVAAELGKEDPDLHPTFFEFVTAMAFLRFADPSAVLKEHLPDCRGVERRQVGSAACPGSGAGSRKFLPGGRANPATTSTHGFVQKDVCLPGGIDAAMPSSMGPVDIALIETGLGGRLDATNVVDPELSVITSISFDHMDLLGDTLGRIAAEKAGIIKPGKPVLIGCLPEEAEEVIRTTAEERGCKLYSVRDRYTESTLPRTNLSGGFQRWNAAVAVYATEILAERFPIESHEALMQIDWPGRWQKMHVDGKTVILDATHNPEGAEALKENLQALAGEVGKPIVIAGTLGEERGRSLMRAIAPYARELYLVEPKQERATSTTFLEGCLPKPFDAPVRHVDLASVFSSDGICALGQQGDTIIVTGSIYLIGEVLEQLSGRSGDGGQLQDKI